MAGRRTLSTHLHLSRRAVLGGGLLMGLAGGLAPGCARLMPRDLPQHDIEAPPLRAANRLRIVIFEIAGLDLPFHAGLIVHTPRKSIIFDPLGHWQSDTCRRENDVFHDPSSEAEAAYLAREGVRQVPQGWTLHLFERAVPAAVAQQAIHLATTSPDYPPLHCAQAVSALLAQLPGFEFVTPGLITADLYRALRAQPAFTYTRRAQD